MTGNLSRDSRLDAGSDGTDSTSSSVLSYPTLHVYYYAKEKQAII
jgi:hypothetical protein